MTWLAHAYYNRRMNNWNQILRDLGEVMTLQQIADACGFASKGHVHDLRSGKKKSVTYELGVRLMALHKKVMAKQQRQAKKELALQPSLKAVA